MAIFRQYDIKYDSNVTAMLWQLDSNTACESNAGHSSVSIFQVLKPQKNYIHFWGGNLGEIVVYFGGF
jgi:hypothetical protein